jgi:RHS repeat-associated protein
MTLARRYYDPYGNPVGTVSAWPDNHAYLGKPTDPSTSLDLLGARQYDPATGRFLSLDPLLQPGNPLAMGGYAYAGNNPATERDPTGLNPCITNGNTCQPVPPPTNNNGGGGGGGGSSTNGGGGGYSGGGGGYSGGGYGGGYAGSGGGTSTASRPNFAILWHYIVNHAMQSTTPLPKCQNPSNACNRGPLGEGLAEYLQQTAIVDGIDVRIESANNFVAPYQRVSLAESINADAAAEQAGKIGSPAEYPSVWPDQVTPVAPKALKAYESSTDLFKSIADEIGAPHSVNLDEGGGGEGEGGGEGGGGEGGSDSSASAAGGVAPYGAFGEEDHMEEP